MKIKLIKPRSFVRKRALFMIMRAFIFLLCTTVFGITSEKSFSQEKILIHVDKLVSVDEVFVIIQDQTKYRFLYPVELLVNAPKVQLKKGEIGVDELLRQRLSHSAFEFDLSRKNRIVIRERRSSDKPVEVFEEQQFEISGTVNDELGQPLPGASIVEKGTTNGTQTDFDGNFSIAVANEDAVLVVSYIGFSNKEIPLAGQTSISVILEESAAGLDEVVVVGFGTQQKLNLTGAVSSVQSEDIQNRPITSASQALQGIQGVYINQVGGQPGNDAATIRVRGVGTLNDNNPLVLVNGIEFSINDLNPNDIESITVLKDAASAAIYGSRAANGVVLVTTKKGSQKSEISYSTSVGIQEVISLPRVVKDPIRWMELYSQAQLNFGTNENALVFPQSLIDEYRMGMQTDPFTYPNTDWYDTMFDPAFIQEHNLRFTGGSDKTSFSLSLGLLDQEGVLRSTDSDRYTANLNINSEMNKSITIGGTFNVSYKNMHEPVVGIAETMQMIFKAQPYHPTKLEDGNYGMNFFDIP